MLMLVAEDDQLIISLCELALFNQRFKSFAKKKQAEIIRQLLPVRN